MPKTGQRFVGALNRFRGASGGAMLMLTALAVPALVGFIGLTVDVAYWYGQKEQLQSAADSAALAATRAMMRGASGTTLKDVATRAATANGFSTVTATVTPDTTAKTITVALTSALPTYFSQVVGVKNVTTSAQATAQYKFSVCILALKPSGAGLWVNGSGALQGKNCSVNVDSNANGAASVTGAGSVTAKSVCVVGTATGGPYSPAAQNGCAYATDPYASLTPPNSSTCNYNGYSATASSVTINPGVYCGGIDTKNAKNITFNPGTYVIKNGPLTSTKGTQITGHGVTFYFTGTNAYLNITGHPDIDLTAPTTGSLAGILFFEDRTQTTEYIHYLTGNTSVNLDGVIYLPAGTLSMTGNSGMTLAGKSVLVAGRIALTGNSTINVNIDPSSSSTMSGGAISSVTLIN